MLPFSAKEVDVCLADIDIRGVKPTHHHLLVDVSLDHDASRIKEAQQQIELLRRSAELWEDCVTELDLFIPSKQVREIQRGMLRRRKAMGQWYAFTN